MSEHIDFVRSIVSNGLAQSGLIELHAHFLDRHLRIFISTSGRIGAAVDTTGVHFKRQLGPLDELKMTWSTLRELNEVINYWRSQRDQWAVFETSGSGFPPGFGGGRRVQFPGASSKYALVHKGFIGHEELREPMSRVQRGFSISTEIWRVGEVGTPEEGWPVGIRCNCENGYNAEARRHRVRFSDGNSGITFESCDDAIVTLLLRFRNQANAL